MISTNTVDEDDTCVCVCFTFSPDATHRDSVSMHLEFLRHLSSCLLRFTDNSDCLETEHNLNGALSSTVKFKKLNEAQKLVMILVVSFTCPLQKLVRPWATTRC